MKVLIFTPMVGRGGLKLVVENLLQGFKLYAPKDWSFTVLGQAYDEIGIPVHHNLPFTQIRPAAELPRHPDLFPFLLKHADTFMEHLREEVGRIKPDIVFCLSPWWVARARDWSLPVPILTFIPDFAFEQGIDLGQMLTEHFRYSAQLLSRRSGLTIFSSAYQRDFAVRNYHFPEDATAVIRHSADYVVSGLKTTAAEAKRVRKVYGLPDDYVLAFHVFSAQKDLPTILRAQHYARSHSQHIPALVLAGIETEQIMNPNARRTRRLLQEVGARFGEDLFVTGFIPDADIGGLFAGARLCISASLVEGYLSGTTLTSLITKTPHLWSNIPVYAEVLDETMGYSFPPEDFESAGMQIIEICEHPKAAEYRALKAYQWALKRTLKDVIADYIKVFEGVRA